MSTLVACTNDTAVKDNKSAVGDSANGKSKVVAKIGTHEITENEILESMSSLPVKQKILIQTSSEQMNKYIDSYINKQLLYEAALNQGLDKQESINRSVEEYKKKLLIRELSKQILEKEITDQELEDYYNINKEKYKSVIVRQIFILPNNKEDIDSEIFKKEADDMRALIIKDQPIDKNNNNDKYSARIKESVKINAGEQNKSISDTALSMKKGDVSKPIKLNNSYLIIKLLKDPEYLPFKNVENNIRFEIRNTNFENYLSDLKKTSGAKIYSDKLNTESNNEQN